MFKIETEFPFQLSDGNWINVKASCDRVWAYEANNLSLQFTDHENNIIMNSYDNDTLNEIEYEAIHWLMYEKEKDVNQFIINEYNGDI